MSSRPRSRPRWTPRAPWRALPPLLTAAALALLGACAPDAPTALRAVPGAPAHLLVPTFAYTQVSAGYYHSCAVTPAGAAQCWGDDSYGQTAVPADLGPVTQVSAGTDHSCAVTTAGAARCWGWNYFGQAAVRPTSTTHVLPTAALTAPAAVAAGQPFALALGGAQVPGYPAATAFTYQFDCGDGQGYAAPSPNASTSCPTTAAGPRAVRGKVVDQSGDTAAYGASVLVTQAVQTVSFTSAAPSPAYVGATYAPGAAATSGLAAVITSLTPTTCTLASGTVTFAAAGACTLAADQAGNATYTAAARATQTITIVRHPQAITFSPAPPASALLRSSLTLTATGGTSGSPVVLSLTGTCTIAGTTVTFTAVGACTITADQGGTTSYDPAPRVTRTIAVVYAFTGFFAPVNALPTVNTASAGQAIPLTFALGGNQGLGVLAAGSPTAQAVACQSGASTGTVTQAATAGASGLQYNAASGQYTYVWMTNKAWAGTCRLLTLTLADGTQHTASFQFTK